MFMLTFMLFGQVYNVKDSDLSIIILRENKQISMNILCISLMNLTLYI